MVIFPSDTLVNALIYIKAMFGIGSTGLTDTAVLLFLKQDWFYYLAALFCCVPAVPLLEKKFGDSRAGQWTYAVGLLAIFVVSVSFICNNSYNPFIYFNF